MGTQLSQLFTIRPVHGNTASLGNKPDNLIAWNRLAAASDVVHQVTYPFHHDTTVVFTATLRCVRFLLKLFQRGGILFGSAWLIKLRLQEVHHLVEADVSSANRRQQFIQLIETVARQQMFFRFFQADA